MAASKFAAYDTGYDDERFEQIVSQTLHCIICTNVIKDPIMCRHNEHVFCRGCITRHLVNSQTCPTCMEPLTVDTLKVPRNISNLLSELKIRCEFFNRGCERFLQLGDLEKHLADCGFAPAVCSNEGCNLDINKQDLLHHETAVCEQRRVKCHSCNDISHEVNIVKANLASINAKFERIEKKFERSEAKITAVEDNVVSKLELVQKTNRRLEADNVEMKKCLNEIMKQLKKGIAQDDAVDREPNVVIAGGDESTSKTVEMFSLASGIWTRLQPTKERHSGATSFVYNNQLFVLGGFDKTSMEKLSLNEALVDQSRAKWEIVRAELPGSLYAHGSVLYQGRLIVIGGYDGITTASSDRITEISLVPPYPRKLLSTMPQTRYFHGVATFGDKILIVGGMKTLFNSSTLKNVVMYDIIKNECRELAPLPYPVSQMATVKWGEHNVILMGGADSNDKALNTVVMYNIKTQKSHMLPDMKYKRKGCVAAVVRDTVIVMGGQDGRKSLKSVESFRFDGYSWQELPRMHEARCIATAAVCL